MKKFPKALLVTFFEEGTKDEWMGIQEDPNAFEDGQVVATYTLKNVMKVKVKTDFEIIELKK